MRTRRGYKKWKMFHAREHGVPKHLVDFKSFGVELYDTWIRNVNDISDGRFAGVYNLPITIERFRKMGELFAIS